MSTQTEYYRQKRTEEADIKLRTDGTSDKGCPSNSREKFSPKRRGRREAVWSGKRKKKKKQRVSVNESSLNRLNNRLMGDVQVVERGEMSKKITRHIAANGTALCGFDKTQSLDKGQSLAFRTRGEQVGGMRVGFGERQRKH